MSDVKGKGREGNGIQEMGGDGRGGRWGKSVSDVKGKGREAKGRGWNTRDGKRGEEGRGTSVICRGREGKGLEYKRWEESGRK